VPYVRTVRTSSGATAVQIVYSCHRGSRQIEHIGSAHDDAELELLKAVARPRAASEFAAVHGQVCYKPLTATAIPGPGGQQVVYAVRLAASEVSGTKAAAIRGTAHQFQKWIDAAFAVRMVVVDAVAYPAMIRAHSDAARIDWRSDYEHLTYETVAVPGAVRDSAVGLVRDLGLRFSSMDLLVDREDRWWFIDLNPSGQWCWIPNLQDQVAAALANALAKGPR
jgi:hypothetical protein